MSKERSHRDATAAVEALLESGEVVEAILPFAAVPKGRRGSSDRGRVGIRQKYRRYRPIVMTDRRLFVLETGRTPHPRGVLAEFRHRDVGVVSVTPGRFGVSTLVLDLNGVGEIPFVTGRLETEDLATLLAVLGPPRSTAS
jgi:hypothetical protein